MQPVVISYWWPISESGGPGLLATPSDIPVSESDLNAVTLTRTVLGDLYATSSVLNPSPDDVAEALTGSGHIEMDRNEYPTEQIARNKFVVFRESEHKRLDRRANPIEG